MFFFVLSFITLLVTATTTTITEHPPNPSPTNSADCSQIGYNPVCCTLAVSEKAAPAVSVSFNHLDIVIDAGTQLFGLNCLPIVSGRCTGNVLCCENTTFGTLLDIGCVNIMI